METNVKRREILKNILIIFLILMLIMTFFSNTIMNRSLPEVATQYANYKQISDKIRASGSVTAKQDYSLVVDEARLITEVLANRGDRINRGDVLFVLDETESSNVTALETDLNNLLIQRQQKLLDNAGSSDIDNQIADLKEQIAEYEKILAALPGYDSGYEKLKTDYENKITALENTIESLNTALESPTEKLEELQNKMSRYETTYDKAEELKKEADEAKKLFDAAEKTYNEAKAAVEAKEAELENITDKTDAYKEEIDSLNDRKAEYQELINNLGGSQSNLQQLYDAMIDARSALRAIEVEYDAFTKVKAAKAAYDADPTAENQAAYTEALSYYEDVAQMSYGDRSEGDYTRLLESRSAAEDKATKAYNTAADKSSEYNKYSEKIADLDRKIKGYQSDIDAVASETAKLQKELTKLQKTMSEAEPDKTKYESEYKSADSRYNYALLRDEADVIKSGNKTINKQITEKNKELEKLKAEKDKVLSKYTDDNPGDKKATENSLKDAKRSLEKLEEQKASDSANESINSAIKRLELDNLNKQITAKQRELDRARKKLANNEITSPVSGTITSIAFTAGEEITAGSTAATIAISEKGYSITFSVTNEQAQRIRVGDIATLNNYYHGVAPELQVVSIKSEQGGRNKTVELSVSGEDVTVGQTLNFSLGDKSRSYDKVVPTSALREDSKGKYVLVVDSKSTPLGNRYTARRVNVEVIASDETSSALSGELEGGEFIITTSSSPVSDGMQVRLADKN